MLACSLACLLAILTLMGLQQTVAMFTQAVQQFIESVQQIDGLELVGKPDMWPSSPPPLN